MELISVHIPKTAGVAFRSLLQKVYGVAAVALDYGDRVLDPASTFQTDPARWQSEVARQAADYAPEIRVIHGHFAGGKYDRAFPEAHKIVWLREPVARLVSHYHYWQNLPPTPHGLHRLLLERKLSLLEFARLEGMRDVLSRVFLPGCHLEDFAFVGLQEHFTADLRRLARQLNWPDGLAVQEENKNASPAYQASRLGAAELAEIADLNAADVALYQQALAMRAAG